MDINAEIIEQFLNDLYMDDNVTGFEDRVNAFEFYLLVKVLMKEGAFILRKWASNDKELMKLITEYERLYFNENCTEKVQKILGVSWNSDNDMLTFDLNDVMRNSLLTDVVTKRHVLRTLAQIYDPLGILAVPVFTLKVCFKKYACKRLIGTPH